jgi:hypothetical protein
MSNFWDHLDNAAIAPLLAVLATIGFFVVLVTNSISFDEFKIGYPLTLAAIGVYAGGRNIRRDR